MATAGMAGMVVTRRQPPNPPKRRNDAMDMPTRHDHAGHAHHNPPSEPNAAALKDPVCGMAVTA